VEERSGRKRKQIDEKKKMSIATCEEDPSLPQYEPCSTIKELKVKNLMMRVENKDSFEML